MDDALRFIPYAIALGQHRNFARTAEALHMSQPHLSRRIAALERSLGVPLFDRTRAGAIPTVFGRALIARGEAQDSKDTLRKNTEEAVTRGAYGAPTFFVGSQLFWGNDRIHFVEEAARAD